MGRLCVYNNCFSSASLVHSSICTVAVFSIFYLSPYGLIQTSFDYSLYMLCLFVL